MNFRRLPFQFTTVNPSERQAEIRKRFGLSNPSDMILDLGNSSDMGAGYRESNSATSSPRLQHRVPVFVEHTDPWISEKSRNNNVDNGKKPNVRVIPIEYEGDKMPLRQRTFSGPAGIQQNNSVKNVVVDNDIKPVKHTMSNMTLPNRKRVPSGETKPRVYNIPIQIEKRDSSNEPVKKPNLNSSPKDSKTNGCKVTKTSSDDKLQKSEEKVPEPGFQLQLKKIDDILEDLKSYALGVESFSGAANDKQYRYLDEMLTRLMLRLDDIETMGNSEVRNARKAAIKKVQSYIDLLETKINSDSKEKDAGPAISVDSKDLSDIKESKLDTENDMPKSSTENVELQEVPEIEMMEATVTEAQEIVEYNKTDLDNHERKDAPEIEMVEPTEAQEIIECVKTLEETTEIPEVEMVEEYATDLEKMDSCNKKDLDGQESNSISHIQDVPAGLKINEAEMEDETESCKDTDDNLELLHSTERNASESQPETVSNLELTESNNEDRQVTNIIELKESPSLETSSDVDMVESLDSRNKNEPCVLSSDDNCDIGMSDCSLLSIKNTPETMSGCSLNIPENASHCDMNETLKEILDEGSTITTSNQNSELLRS